jgi:hypothetical protein
VSGSRPTVLGSAALVAALAGACAEVGGGPETVVSLGFDTSTVAVVVGDTLRDTVGRVLPLQATPFDATGDTLRATAVAVSYVVAPSDSADSAAVVRVAGSLLIGLRLRTTPARVFATAGGLQSLPKSVDVIRRPTRLLAGTAADSAVYVPNAGLSALSAGGAQLRVTADSAGTAVGVRRVAVRFAIERAAVRIADSVVLIDERTPTFTPPNLFVPRSPLDTSDGTGVAGRRVLVYLRANATGSDTVVLRATAAHPARFGSATLAADTVRITVPIRPR